MASQSTPRQPEQQQQQQHRPLFGQPGASVADQPRSASPAPSSAWMTGSFCHPQSPSELLLLLLQVHRRSSYLGGGLGRFIWGRVFLSQPPRDLLSLPPSDLPSQLPREISPVSLLPREISPSPPENPYLLSPPCRETPHQPALHTPTP